MNKKEIASFIKESVNNLIKTDDNTTYKLTLDSNFAIYVGWGEGFDENDNDFIHSKKQPQYCICIKIAENIINFSWDVNMPWYADTGEVYDTDTVICSDENYTELADSMLYYYDDMTYLLSNGEITFGN